MARLPRVYNVRRAVVLALAALLVVCAYFSNAIVFPAYSRLRSLKSMCRSRQQEYSKLKAHLAVSGVIKDRFDTFANKINQRGSEEEMLSKFLQDLEADARQPTMGIVNIKPLPVQDIGLCTLYRVKMAVAGTLQDVTRFMSLVTDGGSIVGVESFSLRAVQGASAVELAVVLRMVGAEPVRPASAARTGQGRRP